MLRFIQRQRNVVISRCVDYFSNQCDREQSAEVLKKLFGVTDVYVSLTKIWLIRNFLQYREKNAMRKLVEKCSFTQKD